jgi:hypothetical protein
MTIIPITAAISLSSGDCFGLSAMGSPIRWVFFYRRRQLKKLLPNKSSRTLKISSVGVSTVSPYSESRMERFSTASPSLLKRCEALAQGVDRAKLSRRGAEAVARSPGLITFDPRVFVENHV